MECPYPCAPGDKLIRLIIALQLEEIYDDLQRDGAVEQILLQAEPFRERKMNTMS